MYMEFVYDFQVMTSKITNNRQGLALRFFVRRVFFVQFVFLMEMMQLFE